MNAKQLAGTTFLAVSIGASMPVALAHDGQHEGESPEGSPGLVRAVRQTTQKFQESSGMPQTPRRRC
jgi:hypothetical protein